MALTKIFFLFLPTFYFSIVINVRDYGAKGNGKDDDTAVFQKCVDLLKKKGGGTMVVPRGDYPITFLTFFGKGYSNITISGENANILQTIARQRISVENNKFQTYAKRFAADGCFVFDAQVTQQTDDRNSIKNIKISGLNFISDVKKYGFDELLHQVSAHGVSNFTIENCTFTGFLSDGIAINGGTDFSKFHDAYNKDVSIINCTFDGVNKNNRQGISIYYSDGFLIDGCVFKNTTRDDMPGAIDIEPDRGINVVRNGVIRNCKFYNIGGIAAICIVIKESSQQNKFSNKNYTVENCFFENVNNPLAVIGHDRIGMENPILKVKFINSIAKTVKTPFQIINSNNVLFKNITYFYIQEPIYRPVLAKTSSNITFNSVNFGNIGNIDQLIFYGNAKNIKFINCIFDGKDIKERNFKNIQSKDKYFNIYFYHFLIKHYSFYLYALIITVIISLAIYFNINRKNKK